MVVFLLRCRNNLVTVTYYVIKERNDHSQTVDLNV